MIRPATLQDIDALVDIENQCFGSDILSRRNFRYLLTKGHANTVFGRTVRPRLRLRHGFVQRGHVDGAALLAGG